MKKEDAIRLISALSDAKGAPGFEEDVTAVVKTWGSAFGSFEIDKMGNAYLSRRGNLETLDGRAGTAPLSGRRLRVQLDAHVDEVAFIVQAVEPNGMIRMLPLGGWVSSNVPAHRMLVRCLDGRYIVGLTASKPPHFLSEAERTKAVDLVSILLDVGTSSAAETKALGVDVGEPIVPDVTCCYDEARDLLIGKAFDCRSGCAALLDTLERLDGRDLDVDVVGSFSTQEEVGTRGAYVTSRRVKADLAIVFEGTPCDDTFGDKNLSQTKLHEGPMLRHLDARMITHPRFQRLALDIGRELDIPVQQAVRSGGSTNGAPIHLSNLGIPTIVIGVPVRYIHTAYGMASYADHDAAVRLAEAILLRLNDDVFASL